MQVLVNVGLNVGKSEPVHQFTHTLMAVAMLGELKAWVITAGEWDGVPERSLQVRVEVSEPLSYMDARLQRRGAAVALLLRQECIAIRDGVDRPADPWTLVYADGRVELGGSVADFPVVV